MRSRIAAEAALFGMQAHLDGYQDPLDALAFTRGMQRVIVEFQAGYVRQARADHHEWCEIAEALQIDVARARQIFDRSGGAEADAG